MIYQYVKPKQELQGYINNYQIVHLVFDKSYPIPYKAFPPRAEQGLIFHARGKATIQNPKAGIIYHPPSVFVHGQQVSKLDFYLSSEYLMVKVNFKPGALFRLLGIPTNEFTDNVLDGHLVGQEISRVNEQLANALSYEQMIEIVQGYLLDKVRKIKKDTQPIEKVAHYLLTHPFKHSLDWLASEACLCPRQFDRKFIQHIGIGPKLFSRIVRFNYAYQYKEVHPNTEWLTIALNFGYTDYQHLAKDFKAFTNVSPVKWQEENLRSPKRTLQL